ncbi:MAG: hypothetical protein Q7K29_07230 [Thermoleophilia bacterium]|nr:hypothetical protein [Thermoleophilia bacterium]
MSITPKQRNIIAITLVVLGCIVGTLSVAIVWLNRVVLDTDKYVATVAPLSEDAAIKDAVANRLTNELFTRTDAEQLAKEALPDKVDFLAAPIVGATEGYVNEQVRKLLDSAEFSKMWADSNREAHKFMIKLLTGEGGTVSTEGGKINLDLGGITEIVKARLADRGINLFEKVDLGVGDIQLTIFEYENITTIQSALGTLNKLANWLPLIALVMLAGAIWASNSRTEALLLIGIGLATGMVMLLVAVAVSRGYYLDAAKAGGKVDVPAATSFFDIIMESLKTAVRRMFAFSIVLVIAGLIFGPYGFSVKLRTSTVSLFRTGMDAGGNLDLRPAGAWVTRQKALLRAAGVVLALIILVVMDQPSLLQALLIALLLAAYLGILEFLSRKAVEK